MARRPPVFYNFLDGSLVRAWELVARGAVDRHFAFHTPVLSTVGIDGAARCRTVVLRAVDSARRIVRFHTDSRSPKHAELQADPRCMLLFYDQGQKVQIRLAGRARLRQGDIAARQAWDQSRAQSRACYANTHAPGTVVADPVDGLQQLPDGVASGFDNFVAVEVWVDELEWLYLALHGHRRARYTWSDDGVLAANWLAP